MILDFKKDYILENDVVKLIPLEISHIDDLIEIANEPDIWKYSFVKGNGIEKLTSYITTTIENRKKEKEYPFIVFDKRHNEYAGCTRLYDIIPSLKSLRIGYTWYGEKFRGTGLNKHCKYLMFQFVFEALDFYRIGLGAYIENEISIKAMESVGCKKEGVFRGLLPSPDNEGRSDAILLSILKDEWLKEKKAYLESKLKLI